MNTVPFKDARSEKARSLCHQHKEIGCREVCPLADACKMRAGDNFMVFINRINKAADAIEIIGYAVLDGVLINCYAYNTHCTGSFIAYMDSKGRYHKVYPSKEVAVAKAIAQYRAWIDLLEKSLDTPDGSLSFGYVVGLE